MGTSTAPVTVQALIDLFLRVHVPTLKDPRPLLSRLKRYFPPLANRPLAELTVIEITQWRNGIRQHSAVQAMGCLKDLRHLYNKAAEWNLYNGANLAARIKNERQPMRTTYIREHEMPRALDVILNQPLQVRLYFATLLILACRPIELQRQRVGAVRVWREEDGWHGTWTKPRGTTKTGREHTVPLPPFLAELYSLYLPTLSPTADYMFPGRAGKPLSKEFWFTKWNAIRQTANLPHIWCYDLRRTGSTWANDTSGNLSAVSKGMLDHATYQATDHYVQVMDRPVQAVLTQHETRLLRCAGPLTRRRRT